jgi:hypothetical protein
MEHLCGRMGRMTRRLRVLPLVLLPVLLAGCGTEKAGDAASGGTANPTELAARASALGIAPELVYVTESPGFTLAQQSVGVLGDDGFSAAYSSKNGAVIQLYVERGTMTAATCPKQAVAGVAGEHTTCVRDGQFWYRTGGGQTEYAKPEKGHVVRVEAEEGKVTREVLRKAAQSVHRPSESELAGLLPPARTATAPVKRGDLPSNGDGAPNNDVGTGG